MEIDQDKYNSVNIIETVYPLECENSVKRFIRANIDKIQQHLLLTMYITLCKGPGCIRDNLDRYLSKKK